MVDAQSQTEEFKNSFEIHENPEQNNSSSSFSNPLPSENSLNNGPMQKTPKEQNPMRTETIGDEGAPEVLYDLGSNKKVKVGVWPQRNLLMVHVREYYLDRYGYEKPGQKGIALTVQQYKRLFDSIADIDDDVFEMQS